MKLPLLVTVSVIFSVKAASDGGKGGYRQNIFIVLCMLLIC